MKNQKKADKRTTAPTFQFKLRSKPEIHRSLEQRDSLRVERFSDELEAARLVVIAIDEFIFDVLARPEIKALAKPGATVVRTLIQEKAMSTFTANRVWNEFKAVVMGA